MYPKQLSKGFNNVVIAISSNEAGKIFTPETRVEIATEADNMKYANKINDLVCKFIRIDIDGDNFILIMERIKPMEIRGVEIEVREKHYNNFIEQLKELHNNGFVHHDIKRPEGFGGALFDNIMLTDNGFRLIDVGLSTTKERASIEIFDKYIQTELRHIQEFYDYMINQ